MSNLPTSKYDEGPKRIGIPPSLIKNFNAYEVLKPIKVNTTNEAPLIDLDDSSQSGLTKKSQEDNGFTLVDVFQNIYVTPDLVNNTPKDNKPRTDNIDYEDFFRKLESGKKMNWTQDSRPQADAVNKVNRQCQLDLEQTFDKLVSNHDSTTAVTCHKNISTNHVESFDAVGQEDLIEELLLDKSFVKMKISDSRYPESTPKPRVLSTPMSQNNSPNQCSFPKDEIKYLKNIPKSINTVLLKEENSTNVNKFQNSNLNSPIRIISQKESLKPSHPNYQRESETTSKLDQNMVLSFLKAMECDELKLKSPPHQDKSMSSSNNISRQSSIASAATSGSDSGIFLNSSPNVISNNKNLSNLKSIVKETTKYDSAKNISTLNLINKATSPEIMAAMPVQAVVKDNKAYNKNRQVKSDIVKRNYTKGPDLSEKNIVLPQILHRLGSQKKAHEDKNIGKKRLKLDVGSKRDRNVEIPVKLDPTVLMADCNLERLKALKTRQMFDTFVKDGSILP